MGPRASAGVIAHVLASEGEYVVHVRANVAFELALVNGSTGAALDFAGVWLDPVTGKRVKASSQTDISPLLFEPPPSFKEDVVLHLTML